MSILKSNKISGFVKNFSYTFTSNILSTIFTAISALVVPKLLDIEQYGYYQVYLFYIGYVGITYLGWCDGIYLRIGGQYYYNLNKPLYCTQFWLLGLSEFFIYTIIFGCSLFFSNQFRIVFIVAAICIVGIDTSLKLFISYVLQATARVKEYAITTISEGFLFIVFTVFILLLGVNNFQYIILADIAARIISLSLSVWYCRDIVFAKPLPVQNVICEVKENISAGIKLMLASFCSMLIVGVVRFGIQNHWSIATYGKVALTISVSNLAMKAINAIAIVLYPSLRRTDNNQLPKIYRIMRVVLMGIVFGVLVFYYPIQRLLTAWLPQYAESLRYAAILFPICVYESKMSMLVNTYYKTLRLEKLLMKCNMVTLVLSVVCTIISTLVLNSVTAVILSILFVLIFRCVLSELLLTRHIDIEVKRDIVIELTMTIAFIVCNWFFGFIGMLAYAVFYAVYLFLKRIDLKETLAFVKSMR